MRQTESAMRMLICAYRAVLSNCFNKEFLRGGVKRLAKGAALGTFLTAVLAGFSSSYSYAETISVSEGQSKDYVDEKEYKFEPDNEQDSTIDVFKGDLSIGNNTHEINDTYTDKVLIDSNKFGIHVIGKDIETADAREEASQVQISATTEIVIQQSENTLQDETSAIYVKDRADIVLEVNLPDSYKDDSSDYAGNILIQAQGNKAYGIDINGSVDLNSLEAEESTYSSDGSELTIYPYYELDQNKIPSVVIDNGYGDNSISGVGYIGDGVGVKIDRGRLDVKADNGSNTILGTTTAIDAKNFSRIEISADNNIIGSSDSIKGGGKNAVLLDDFASIDITADNKNQINATNLGIGAENMSDATLRIHYDRGDVDTANKILSNVINVANSEGENAIGLQASNGSYIKFKHRGSNGSPDKSYFPKINNIINVESNGENIVGLKTDDSNSEYTIRYSNIYIDGTTLAVSAIGNNSKTVSGIESVGNNNLDTKVSVVVDDYININVNAKIDEDKQYASSGSAVQGSGVNVKDGGIVNLESNKCITIYSLSEDQNQNKATGFGVLSDGGNVFLNSLKNTVVGSMDGINFSSGTVDITSMTTSSLSRSIDKVSDYNIIIGKEGTGVHAAKGADGKFNAIATSGNNYIAGYENAVWSESSEEGKTPEILIKAEHGSNFIGFDKNVYEEGEIGKKGLLADSGEVSLIAGVDNDIKAFEIGISVNNAEVNLEANRFNIITADKVSEDNPTYEGFGNGYALYSSGGNLHLSADNGNSLYGAIYANGGAYVKLSDLLESNGNKIENNIYSYAYIDDAGGFNEEDNKKVISAIYAEGENTNIVLSGLKNNIYTYAESISADLERVVWAYDKAVIEINGQTRISTDRYQENRDNSKDIALVAGTSKDVESFTYNQIMSYNDKRAKVNINYEGNSSITGDILSAYAGEVNVKLKEGASGSMNVTGNLLAGNNGILNVDLGDGGTLTGRVDDYGDAGVLVGTTHGNGEEEGFFNPAFSSKVVAGGQVNLTMSEGSRWNVTGQSWITRINTENSSNAIIDLVSANTDRNKTAHALTVYELTGNAEFHMSLDADRDFSDMLYIKNADGEYTVNVIDAVSHDDMYADGLDGLRFATVGAGSKAKFSAATFQSGGVKDIVYQVGTDAYAGNDENSVYNGDNMSEHKPGNSTVDGFFENNGKPGEAIPTPATQTLSLAAVNVLAADSEATILAEEETAAPAAEAGWG